MSVGRPKKSLQKYSSKTRDNQNASKGAPMPTSPRRNIVSFLLFAVLLQNISFAMAITPTVSLQTPHPPMSPAQTMHVLAENCAALRELDLTSNSVSDDALIRIVHSCPALSYFNVYQCRAITDVRLALLCVCVLE